MYRAFGVLVFAAWAHRAAWCQFYNEPLGDGRGHNDDHHQEEQNAVKPLYKYGYWVHDPKTKDVKNHWEHRDGDAVHGSYSLLQPDGHMRIVEYTADKHNGFVAHVKYMYQGHEDGDGGAGGGGGPNALDGGGSFGGGGFDFGGHLDEPAGGQSQFGPPAPSQRTKPSLSKFYKKPRGEKPGGPAGHYKPRHHYGGSPFDGPPRPAGGGSSRGHHPGGGYKKPRLPPAAPSEQSAEQHFGGGPSSSGGRSSSGGGGGGGGSHFGDQVRFPSVGSGSGGGGGGGGGSGGGSSPERYHPLSGGGSPFGYPGADQGSSNQPSDLFARKYGSGPASLQSPSATPASAETSSYLSGIQYQSSEHDPTAVPRPDAAPAASSTGQGPGRGRGSSEDDDDAAAAIPRPQAKRQPQQPQEPERQRPEPQVVRSQRSHNVDSVDGGGDGGESGGGSGGGGNNYGGGGGNHYGINYRPDFGGSGGSKNYGGNDYSGDYGASSGGGGGDGNGDVVGGAGDSSSDGGGGGEDDDGSGSSVKITKQPLMEFHFEDQPYPFEVPEGLEPVPGRRYRAPHRKRHLEPQQQQHHPRYVTTSSYFPSWFGPAAAHGAGDDTDAPVSQQFYYDEAH